MGRASGGLNTGVLSDASPSTQAHSDSAATGTGTKASRDDHKHAMPAAGGPSQANQAALEAETNENTYAPPDLIRHSPGVAKAWVSWEQSGAHGILSSHNVTSVTDGGGAGNTDILWADDFSGDEYSIVGITESTGSIGHVAATVLAAGVTTETYDQSGSAFDGSNNMVAAFGDQ